MSGIKVVMLTSEFLPVVGGIGTYVLELVKNLPKANEIIIIAPPYRNNLEISSNTVLPENVSVLRAGHNGGGLLNTVLNQYALKKQLMRVVDDFNPDIIHSQSTMPDLFVNPKEIKIPIVTTIHSTVKGQNAALRNSKVNKSTLSLSEQKTLIMGSFIYPLENRYYEGRNHFITVSNYCAKNFRKVWGKSTADIQVIPNGVDAEVFNPKIKPEQIFIDKLGCDEVTKVLFLSRLVGIKGINILIDCIKILINNANVHFLIAGSGEINSLNAINTNNVSVLGYVPHNLVPSLMAQSDIFILPSFLENCPCVLLEAMASGKAVIAANVGGIPEIIKNGENGLLVPNDAQAFADAITLLINNSQLRCTLGLAARKTVENFYTWNEAAEKTESYYKHVLLDEC